MTEQSGRPGQVVEIVSEEQKEENKKIKSMDSENLKKKYVENILKFLNMIDICPGKYSKPCDMAEYCERYSDPKGFELCRYHPT